MIQVRFCLGLDCVARGGQELLAMIEEDTLFSERVEISFEKCMGACREGAEPPVVEVEGKRYAGLTPERLAELLHGLIGEEA
jgi:NADH:ubiquinone oxidoreductase subunit E